MSDREAAYITKNPLSPLSLSLSAPSSISHVKVIELKSQFENWNFEIVLFVGFNFYLWFQNFYLWVLNVVEGFWCYGFCGRGRSEILKSREKGSKSGFFLFLKVMAQSKPHRLYKVWKGNNVSFLLFSISIGFAPHVMELLDHVLYWCYGLNSIELPSHVNLIPCLDHYEFRFPLFYVVI